MIRKPAADGPLFLGIEGGGTHTVAILADAQNNCVQRFEGGPANVKLLSEVQLLGLLKSIAKTFPQPNALGIGMAGARAESDSNRIRQTAAKVWPAIPCEATNDLETALATVKEKSSSEPVTRVLILSGTGSCCYGRSKTGKTAKIGGWGHILGDKGSGYEIGLRAIKAVLYYLDRDDEWSRLGERLLARVELNEPNEFIAWVQSAEKSEVAGLAMEVFDSWAKGDKIAADILAGAQASLAEDALACARHLASPKEPVEFVLAGSVLLKQPRFVKGLAVRLRKAWPKAVVLPLERESAWGAVALAQRIWKSCPPASVNSLKHRGKPPQPASASLPEMPLEQFGKRSPTEQRNPRSLNLDRLSASKAIELMLSEDAKVPEAILGERARIERAVTLITQTFKRGGSLFYVGAGTSGRLGVLDASECPPTFRTDPEMVQGIMAGGQQALWRSIEGAEDDPLAGARAVEFRGITRRDVVVGIAASGRTPFVWGALEEARKRRAKTILLTFNPYLEIPRGIKPAVIIAPNLGPEVLTGSTRLKAGTATKLILNIFTTLAMVRLGKVVSNLMVDLNPSNVKLRDRAVRIVQDLRNVDYATAESALKKSNWMIEQACLLLPARRNRAMVKET